MGRPFNMSGHCSQTIAQADGGSNRRRGPRDLVAVFAASLIVTRAGAVVADEYLSLPLEHPRPALDGAYQPSLQYVFQPSTPLVPTLFELPVAYRLAGVPEVREFPIDDFKPRGRSILETKPKNDEADAAPTLRNTTMWQRLRDFRSHGRVRLLTLWETGGSALSLQAGRKGEPSLQWTSRSLNRGGATRGLFDQLVSVSFSRAGHGLHVPARPVNTEAAASPAKQLDSGPHK